MTTCSLLFVPAGVDSIVPNTSIKVDTNTPLGLFICADDVRLGGCLVVFESNLCKHTLCVCMCAFHLSCHLRSYAGLGGHHILEQSIDFLVKAFRLADMTKSGDLDLQETGWHRHQKI